MGLFGRLGPAPYGGVSQCLRPACGRVDVQSNLGLSHCRLYGAKKSCTNLGGPPHSKCTHGVMWEQTYGGGVAKGQDKGEEGHNYMGIGPERVNSLHVINACKYL